MRAKEKEDDIVRESSIKKCRCSGCGYEQNVILGVQCIELTCPECKGILENKKIDKNLL
jgi:hypothetical protein